MVTATTVKQREMFSQMTLAICALCDVGLACCIRFHVLENPLLILLDKNSGNNRFTVEKDIKTSCYLPLANAYLQHTDCLLISHFIVSARYSVFLLSSASVSVT